jgi:hypothetical protein
VFCFYDSYHLLVKLQVRSCESYKWELVLCEQLANAWRTKNAEGVIQAFQLTRSKKCIVQHGEEDQGIGFLVSGNILRNETNLYNEN